MRFNHFDVQSTVKIASAVSNTQRNSKSKCTLGTNKLISDAAISSKRKQDMARPSLSAETSSVVSCEKPSQKEVLSGSNNDVDSTRLDVIARRKSDRRNSFTFSLMSGSKVNASYFPLRNFLFFFLLIIGIILQFPKEHGKTLENLPNIYDVRNHLEVSDYVDDIYQYYWVMEVIYILHFHHSDLEECWSICLIFPIVGSESIVEGLHGNSDRY